MELSVVMPCRNVAATLGEQLRALVAQEWDGSWEVIVVDNGSTDSTRAVATEFAAPDRRVRVVEANEGVGVSYVRNTGVRASTAASVAFCDGDDIVEPGWVAAFGTALRDHELVTGPLDVFSLNRLEIARARGTASADRLPYFGAIPFARGNNCGMQRSAFARLGGFDESFIGLEDIELSMRAAALGLSVHYAPGARVKYRNHNDARAIWRQGLFYGGSVPELAVRARRLGLDPPSRWAGVRSWAWIAVHALDLRTRDGRLGLLWVLANRLGTLRGAARARSLHV
jgi:glycosyltransferase involved in cell wall biosynthesis